MTGACQPPALRQCIVASSAAPTIEVPDDLAAAPWALLSEDEAIWLAALGKELSTTIVAAGTFPAR